MKKVVNKNVQFNETKADYELENGILLFSGDWNGECYREGYSINDKGCINHEFVPVYRYQYDNIDISEVEENSDEYFNLTEIIGFDER